MTELARLKFYATQPHPCSYLPEEQATTLFLDPSQPMDTQLYASLSEVGFRRSGDHLYRPHCQHCTACIAARIPVAGFSPNRQQRRILKRNAELQVIRKRPSFNEEYYDLYRRYIEQRHADGDMYPPSRDQFATFLVRDLPFCCFFEFRLHGRLLAIAVTDVLPNGLSAVYTFYDPDEEQRSLGRYAILWQIAETERLGLQAVYLGYWIKNCRKMNYKTQYRPIELFVNQRLGRPHLIAVWRCCRFSGTMHAAFHGHLSLKGPPIDTEGSTACRKKTASKWKVLSSTPCPTPCSVWSWKMGTSSPRTSPAKCARTTSASSPATRSAWN
ncbi:arginyl-tRNA-protein transferase [Pseudomonas aeruginosa]|nr:arginyl-tRNA-protein transferase [Pseudomonas aeruginosa]